MCKEYVLRDNEIAINRPDGTVIIMNLNAYRALAGDSDEVKALRQKVEKIKAINVDVVNAHNACLDELNRLKEKAAASKTIIKNLEDDIDMCDEEIHKLKKDRDLFVLKITELTKENEALKKQNAKLNNDLYEAKKQKVTNESRKLILWGSVKFPKSVPDFVYITDKGEVFFNGAEIERKYNLAKGSVSAYFNLKQKYLYVRSSDGSYVWDSKMQDYKTVGLVDRFSWDIFENSDWNKPNWEKYENAILAAKKHVKGQDNKV